MNTVLWIIAGVLAASFLGAGLLKQIKSKEDLAAAGLGWVEDFSPATIKTIGALEFLAAIGLILPAVLDIVPVLVPIAAVGLIALMTGAAITHARRRELPMITINIVFLAMAVLVAWGRFGPYPFTT